MSSIFTIREAWYRLHKRMEQVLTATIERERPRLWNFIRKRVADRSDAEDILQDVFYQLLRESEVEQVGAWLFRVARNRIIDFFRKKKPEPLPDGLEDLLPSPDASPEAVYERSALLDEIAVAVSELPQAQREVFIAHEVEGQSFKEIAAATGVSVNTLLSRKRYAVRYLRGRLQVIYDEFKGKEK
jgi:RNA polymerase sigma factor (sigma-70 family)